MHVIVKRQASMGVLVVYIHFNHHKRMKKKKKKKKQKKKQQKSNPAVCWSVPAPLV